MPTLRLAKAVFWTSTGLLAYTQIGYPLAPGRGRQMLSDERPAAARPLHLGDQGVVEIEEDRLDVYKRQVRTWFEKTVADEARELGVELSIVEHPHLLTTQIAFTLTGPTGKVDAVLEDLAQRAGAVTRLETYYPIVS